MESSEHTQSRDEQSIISIIQEIKQETLSPRTLSRDVRQRCVGFLLSEGYTEAQIAQILARSEKTVGRDLAEIRVRNALTPNLDWAKQLVGDLYQKAMVHHRYLMRVARNPDATNSDKSQSEFLAWRILKEAVEKLQTLGYLPLKPQQIVEDVFHHMGETDNERSIAEARNTLEEIEKAAKESGGFDADTEKKIKAIKTKIEKAELNCEIDNLVEGKDRPKPKEETPHESETKK